MSENGQPALPDLAVPDAEPIDVRHERKMRLFNAALSEVPFADEYLELVDQGWSWRRAAVIAWLAISPADRLPTTQKGLAVALGCSSNTISKIVRDDAVQAQLTKLTMSTLLAYKADVDMALITSATDPNYKNNQDRKTFYSLIGALDNKHTVTINSSADEAMREKSDAELMEMAQLGEGGEDE